MSHSRTLCQEIKILFDNLLMRIFCAAAAAFFALIDVAADAFRLMCIREVGAAVGVDAS